MNRNSGAGAGPVKCIGLVVTHPLCRQIPFQGAPTPNIPNTVLQGTGGRNRAARGAGESDRTFRTTSVLLHQPTIGSQTAAQAMPCTGTLETMRTFLLRSDIQGTSIWILTTGTYSFQVLKTSLKLNWKRITDSPGRSWRHTEKLTLDEVN